MEARVNTHPVLLMCRLLSGTALLAFTFRATCSGRMSSLIVDFTLFQQKADLRFNFVPRFELSPKVTKSGEIVDTAFC